MAAHRAMERGVKKKSKRKKARRRALLFRLAAIAFGAMFAVSAVMFFREMRQTKKEAETFSDLAALRLPRTAPTPKPAPTATPARTPLRISFGEHGELITPEPAPVVPTEEPAEAAPAPLQRYLPLYELNPDFFGWLTIPDTNVDYPVMQSVDEPQRYLHRDYYGNRSYGGVPFLDADCDPNGNFYLVYGHKMRDGSMFGTLTAYERKSFWETHRTFFFDTLYEERTYEVVLAMRARVLDKEETSGFRYYNYTSLNTEEEFQEYMTQAKKLSLYDTGVEASFGDELLVLSTCHHYVDSGRFVVIARRVDG